jgi:ribosomal protein S18 acetylase RimI-like enzyme
VNVRAAREADLDACVALFDAVAAERRWLATEPPVDLDEVRARWAGRVDSREGTLLLAEETAGAPPVGVAVMVGSATPELGMLVAASHRRLGVGHLLLDACAEWARKAGAREVVLHVFVHNAAAIALYRKHGFEDRGILRRAYVRRSGEKWDALRMVKTLAAPMSGGGTQADP